jgi:outer membrane protein assembly factor BamB
MKRFLFTLSCLCILGALAGCSSPSANTLKPSALVRFTPSLSAHPLWQRRLGQGNGHYYFRLRPGVSQGIIYASNYDGTVTSVNARTGRRIWSVNLGMHLTSGVAVSKNNLYLASANATIIALSKQDGHRIWQTPVSGQVWASPQYSRGIVLIHTTTGNLTALSASTGHQVWRYHQRVPALILHAASQPQVTPTRVVAGFANGLLAVLNFQTGNPVWQEPIAIPKGNSAVEQMVDITVDPVVVNGIIYVATYQGRISALSLDNGQLIWQHKLSSFAGMTADNQSVYVTDAQSRIWAFDEDTGAITWRQTHLLGRRATGPVVYKNSVVVADGFGYLHFLSKSNGRFIARLATDGSVLARPFTDAGNVYVYTTDGRLMAFNAA